MSSPAILSKKRKSNLRKKEEVEVSHENDDIFQDFANLNSNNLNNSSLCEENYSTPKKEPSSISSSSCDFDEIEHPPSKKTKLIKQTKPSDIIPKVEEKTMTLSIKENYPTDEIAKPIVVTNDNNEVLIDLETHFQNTTEAESVSSKNKSNNYTIVDIILIFSKTVFGPVLAAATFSNFFGGRHYLMDSLNCCSKLMYWTYIQQILNDTTIVSKNSDVSYLFHKNNRPINLLSYLPRVENKYYAEDFKETIKKLTAHFDGKPDPSNEGKLFKFNYLQEFHLNTNDRITTFSKLCKKVMVLPDKFTLAHQGVMDIAGELPNSTHHENN